MTYLRNIADRAFGIDLRALGLFRIALGTVLLFDTAFRFPDAEVFYSDFGAVPRDMLLQTWWNPGYVSVHMMNGTVLGAQILLLLQAFFAILLLAGWRTRIATFFSWFLLVSIQDRNPLVLQGGDMLIRMLLLWGIFLPMGSRYSLDAYYRPGAERPKRVLSVGSAALLLQLAMMYVFTALLKDGPEWHSNGNAIFYALHIEAFTKPLGYWLRQFPAPLRPLTIATWWLEIVLPPLLFLPWFTFPLRLLGIAAFVGLHVGLYFSMELGIFPFISIASMIAFLPSEAMDWIEKKLTWSFPSRVTAWLDGRTRWKELASRPFWSVGFVGNHVALFLLALCLLWNVDSVAKGKFKFPALLEQASFLTRTDQLWDMFAPAPTRDDGWFVVKGWLENEQEVDPAGGVPGVVTFDKPAVVADVYRNDRWRSYYMNLWRTDNVAYRPYFTSFLCRKWNRRAAQGERLAHIDFYYVKSEITDDPSLRKTEPFLIDARDCIESFHTYRGPEDKG